MIVNPNKVIFFTATALMCAVSFAGSMMAQAETTSVLASAFGAPRQLTLPPGFTATQPGDVVEGPDSTASIVPNARSCPSRDVAAALAPAGTQKANDPARAGGLGSGRGCPAAPADVRVPGLIASSGGIRAPRGVALAESKPETAQLP